MSSQLLFFFSALGVFNALLICIYFFFVKKPKSPSNYFFGVMLLMLTIRVGKSVVFYFDNDLSAIFLQIGISALVFVGPALYFYLNSVLHPAKKPIGNWIYHFGLLFIGITTVGILYPWSTYHGLWSHYLIDTVYGIWFIYILLSGFLLKDIFRKVFSKTIKTSGFDFWLISVFSGNLIIWIAYRTAHYTSYIAGALSFSFVFYLMFLLILFKRKKISIFKETAKYSDKKIDTAEAKGLLEKLNEIMHSEKLYTNADLKLSEVAHRMNIIPHKLSQLLNDNLGKSFTNYINEYRIEEAKRMISQNDLLTIEAIGFDCGFNSKSTFYTAFKKHSGTTPAKFKELI